MPSPEELAANKRHAFSLNDGRKFTELYNVQHLQSAQLDSVSRVCISTIQRLYSMLLSLFFWWKIFTVRRDQHEETSSASCAFNEACRERFTHPIRWRQVAAT